MAKRSKPSVRKSTPPNEWFKNAARSMGLAGMDIITQLTPATGEFLSDNINFGKEIIENVRESRKSMKSITQMLNVSEQAKIVQDIIKNAKEDLRTGNFWNTERESGFDEFDIGDDFDFLDIDESDSSSVEEDEDGNVKVVNKNVQVNVVSDTKPVVKALEGNAKTTIQAAEAIIASNKNLTHQSMISNQQLTIASIKGLEMINQNLGLLVDFQNDSMTKYIAASIKYYDESLTEIRKGIQSLEQMVPKNSEINSRNKMKEVIDVFGAYGGLNIKEYLRQVKKNIKDSDNPFISNIQMMLSNESFIQSIVDAPLKAITKSMVNVFVPNVLKKTMKQFDESFGAFAPALMMKINKNRESDNPFFQLLGDIFGVKTRTRTSIDTKLYERGPVPWDGVARRALTEVIPRQLSAIHSAITGQTERMFDYQEGVWRSIEEMKKSYEDAYISESTRGYSSIMGEIKDILSRIHIDSSKDREAIDNAINKFFSNLTKKDYQINPTKLDQIKEVYDFGGDPSLAEFFQALVLNTSRSAQLEAFGMGQMRSRQQLAKFIESVERDPSLYNAGLLFSNADFNKDFEKNEYGKLVPKKGFGINIIDKFGKTQLDYLREILHTLQEGIPVCDTCGGKKGKGKTSNIYSSRFERLKELEDRYVRANTPKVRTDTDTSDKELDYLKRGMIRTGTISELAPLDGYDAVVKSVVDLKRSHEEQDVGIGRKTVDFISKNLLSGSAQENFNKVSGKVEELVERPARLLEAVFDKIDKTMYNIVFDVKDPNGNTFLPSVINRIQVMFEDVSDFAKKKVFTPIIEFFVGESGIWKNSSKENPIAEMFFKKIKEFFWGGMDDKGEYHPGIFEGVKNGLKDTSDYIIHMVTGREYTDSKGVTHPKNEDSVAGIIKSGAKTALTETKKYLLGDKDNPDPDKQKGSLSFVVEGVKESAEEWRNAIFGPKGKSELYKEGSRSFAEMREKIGRGMPKAVVGGIAGGAVATGLAQSMGMLGVMGSAILPGGPLGFALMGASLGLLTESDRFMDWAFGPKNDAGRRTGGAILKANQIEFLKRNKRAMIGGATVGLASELLGFGILPAFLGPTGPLGAAVMGAASGILFRSEKVQELLFGPKNADGKRVGGIIHKTFGKINKGLKDENNLGKRKFFNTALGAAGGYGIGTLVATTGLVGSLFSPAAPLGLAVAGAAAGISLTSERWKKFVFGEWDDEEGVRKGGIAQRFVNWTQIHIFDPMKIKIQDTISDMSFWFKDTIVESLRYGLSPIKDAAVTAGKDLLTGFKVVAKKGKEIVGEPIKEHVAIPVGKVLSATVVTPAKFVMKKTFDLQKGLFKTLFGLPAKMIEGLGKMGDAALMARGIIVGGAKEIKRTKNPFSVLRPRKIQELALGEDGASDYLIRKTNREYARIQNAEKRAEERKRIREARKDLRKRRKIAGSLNYESYDEHGNDMRWVYNVARSRKSYDRYVRKGIGNEDFNRRMERAFGVTANQLLELRGDRDIRNITKEQQKDLARKIKKAQKLGLKGDELLNALGVKKVPQSDEEAAKQATIKMADTIEKVRESIDDKTFNIKDKSQQDILTNIIAKAIKESHIETSSNKHKEENVSLVDILKEKQTENESSDTPKKRERLGFFEFMKENLSNRNMGISAFGRPVIKYKDQLNMYTTVPDQNDLRRGYIEKMGLSKPLGKESIVEEFNENKQGIPVRIVGESGRTERQKHSSSQDDFVSSSGVKELGQVLSKRGTSTLGIGTLFSKMFGIGRGIAGGLRGAIRGRIGVQGLFGGGPNLWTRFFDSITSFARGVSKGLDSAYNANRSSRILGVGGGYSTSAEATDNFQYLNDGTPEYLQRQMFAKRRNVNEFLSRKTQEEVSKMDARFKHANIDLLSQVAINTRMIAELLGNEYDLHHGFYTWLRDWLENFNPCCGGTGFGGTTIINNSTHTTNNSPRTITNNNNQNINNHHGGNTTNNNNNTTNTNTTTGDKESRGWENIPYINPWRIPPAERPREVPYPREEPTRTPKEVPDKTRQPIPVPIEIPDRTGRPIILPDERTTKTPKEVPDRERKPDIKQPAAKKSSGKVVEADFGRNKDPDIVYDDRGAAIISQQGQMDWTYYDGDFYYKDERGGTDRKADKLQSKYLTKSSSRKAKTLRKLSKIDDKAERKIEKLNRKKEKTEISVKGLKKRDKIDNKIRTIRDKALAKQNDIVERAIELSNIDYDNYTSVYAERGYTKIANDNPRYRKLDRRLSEEEIWQAYSNYRYDPTEDILREKEARRKTVSIDDIRRGSDGDSDITVTTRKGGKKKVYEPKPKREKVFRAPEGTIDLNDYRQNKKVTMKDIGRAFVGKNNQNLGIASTIPMDDVFKGSGGVLKSGGKTLSKLLPGLGIAATIGFGAMDAKYGYQNADQILGKDISQITKADRIGAAASSAIVGTIPFADIIDETIFNGKLKEVLGNLSSALVSGFTNLIQDVGGIWEGVKEKVITAKDTIVETVTTSWENIKTSIAEGWENTKTNVTTKIDEIKQGALEKWENIKTSIAEGWEGAKTNVTTKISEIKQGVLDKWEGIKTTISTGWDNAKTTVTNKITDIKNNAQTKWESIKTGISNKWDEIKTAIVDKIKGVKTAIDTKLSNLKTDVQTAIGDVVSAITGPLSKVKGWIDEKLGPVKSFLKRSGGNGYGHGTGVDSYLQDQSKSFIKKTDKLGNFTANVKLKENDFGKGGPTIQDLDKQLRRGELPSDNDTNKAIYNAFMVDPFAQGKGEKSCYGQGCDNNKNAYGFGPNDVYYSQNDPRWKNKKLEGKATMGTSGCGPTVASMVVSSLTGEDVLPTEAAEYAKRNGYVDEQLGVSSALFYDFGKQKGVDVKQVEPTGTNIVENLSKGNKVILRGEGKNFTESGHFVVASDLTPDGKIKINDPLGKSRSGFKRLKDLEGTTHAFVATVSVNGIGLSKPKTTYGHGLGHFSNPVPGATVTSPFGWRTLSGVREFHYGIDLAKSGDVPVQAAADGVVTRAEYSGSYGYVVMLRHTINGKEMNTTYAHLRENSITVKKGDKVKRGQVIGKMGSTGRATGQHLHFEIHDGPYVYDSKTKSLPNAVDPAPYIFDNAVPTPNPFGDNGGSNVIKRAAQQLREKLNSIDLIPDLFKQVEHAFTVGLDNLLFGTNDPIVLFSDGKSGSIPNLKGNSNVEKVWNFFKQQGFSNAAIAGILGNLHQESGVDPTKRQVNGPAKGIAQWEGQRWERLVNKARARGVSEWDLSIQLQHIIDELNGEDRTTKYILDKNGGLNALKNATDYRQATKLFQEAFERAGKPNYENRYKYAEQYLKTYGSGFGKGDTPLVKQADMDKLRTNLKNIGGPDLSNKGDKVFVDPDNVPLDSILGRELGFALGTGIASVDSRYDSSSVRDSLKHSGTVEKEIRHVIDYANGTGTGNVLTEEDIEKVLHYLATIAENTTSLRNDVVSGELSSRHTKAGGTKTNSSGDNGTLNDSIQNSSPITPKRGNNIKNVNHNTYSRVYALGRGRR